MIPIVKGAVMRGKLTTTQTTDSRGSANRRASAEDDSYHDVVDVGSRVTSRDERARGPQCFVRLVRRESARWIASAVHHRMPRGVVDDRAGRVGRAVAPVGARGEERDAGRV